MDRLRDGMVTCAACSTTNFWDPTEPRPRLPHRASAALRPPFLLKVGRRNLAVSALATLRSDHLASGVDDPQTARPDPPAPDRGPERWGLHNTSDFAWQVAYPGGQQHVLEPDQTIEMLDGARIQIGTRDGRRPPSLRLTTLSLRW